MLAGNNISSMCPDFEQIKRTTEDGQESIGHQEQYTPNVKNDK